jgi:Protein of unknown function (Gmx_para_CXXCG)
MKAFRLEPGSHVKFEYDITRTCGLPGINCPECGATWAQTGNAYPSVDDPCVVDIISDYPPVVSLDEFKNLSERLELYLSDRPCYPGLALGQLHGRRLRYSKLVAWANTWTVLFGRSIISTLKTDVKFVKTTFGATEMFEFEVYQKVKIKNETENKICRKCGRNPISVPKNLVLDKSTFDSSVSVQRITELPTVLIVNEQIKDMLGEIEEIELTEIELR